jgi:hypothetical protein
LCNVSSGRICGLGPRARHHGSHGGLRGQDGQGWVNLCRAGPGACGPDLDGPGVAFRWPFILQYIAVRYINTYIYICIYIYIYIYIKYIYIYIYIYIARERDFLVG